MKITNDYLGLLSFLKFSLSKEYDDFQKHIMVLAKPFRFILLKI